MKAISNCSQSSAQENDCLAVYNINSSSDRIKWAQFIYSKFMKVELYSLFKSIFQYLNLNTFYGFSLEGEVLPVGPYSRGFRRHIQSGCFYYQINTNPIREIQPENRTVSMDKCHLSSAPMPELQWLSW